MTNDRWALLESIQERLNSLSDLPPEIMIAIADRLEEAISASSRTPLRALSDQLAGLFNKLLRTAPIEAVNAVRGTASADAAESAAYMLGQVSFAQLLAAQTAERRADDDFLVVIRDHRYENYIRALSTQDCTGVELAEITGERVETVSRKLKTLRELGITDFRREGTKLLNFLTPATCAVVSGLETLTCNTLLTVAPPKPNLSDIFDDLPAYMHKPAIFGRDSPHRALH